MLLKELMEAAQRTATLTELSRQTVGAYRKKAQADLDKTTAKDKKGNEEDGWNYQDSQEELDAWNKMDKRKKGLARANGETAKADQGKNNAIVRKALADGTLVFYSGRKSGYISKEIEGTGWQFKASGRNQTVPYFEDKWTKITKDADRLFVTAYRKM